MGQGMAGSGQGNLGAASDAYGKYAGMTQEDYQGMISGAMNSDLVQRQKEMSNRNIQDTLNSNVQQLNQQSTASGNMGSSRAGVAQGVMTSKAMQAQSDANLAIDQNAYQNAISSVNNQISSSLSGASGLGSLGQFQVGQGMQGVNQGTNWLNQIQQNNISDLNNMFTAGTIRQQNAQNQANVNWQNQVNSQNPALTQWQQLVNALGPAAGWSTHATGKNTATVSGGGGGIGGALGGLAGAGIGGYFGSGAGAMAGSGVGSGLGSLFG